MLKPVASGSSFGLYILSTTAEIEAALDKMAKESFGDYLAEEFLDGRELTVGVIETPQGLMALPASEVVLNKGFAFDYEGKYLGRGTTEVTPAQITPGELAQAQRLALSAHKKMNCRGYSRTDMILTARGPVYLETNTLPGLSKASFLPQQLAAAQILMSDFLNQQLQIALT